MTSLARMREYETIYIMRATLDDTEAKNTMLSHKELIEKHGGKNIKVTAMGRKKIAWECQKETRGIFVHHRFVGKPGIVKELDRAMTINDTILVRQSIVLQKNVDPELIKVEEDMLTPPVIKEKKEFSDRRPRYDRGDMGGPDRPERRERRYDDDRPQAPPAQDEPHNQE